jgi:hypothetical protein
MAKVTKPYTFDAQEKWNPIATNLLMDAIFNAYNNSPTTAVNVVTAAVGGTQTTKIAVVISGNTFYIPLYTA